MVIVDRGFDNLWTLVERKFHGTLAANLFKYGSGGWNVQNAYEYLKPSESNCYKVVMCDKSDDIVLLPTSQMVGIANEIYALKTQKYEFGTEIMTTEQARLLAESVMTIINLDYLLSELMDEVEVKIDK